jgi:hypothetical protein
MAERLKEKLLAPPAAGGAGADLVVGPDAYRDLPLLVAGLRGGALGPSASTALSIEETYADIAPVREAGARAAFVTVMRGCSNMCSFCIVPHVRGRERSRPLASIEDEVARLRDAGVREVTLLGQNVNSYHDAGERAHDGAHLREARQRVDDATRIRSRRHRGRAIAHLAVHRMLQRERLEERRLPHRGRKRAVRFRAASIVAVEAEALSPVHVDGAVRARLAVRFAHFDHDAVAHCIRDRLAVFVDADERRRVRFADIRGRIHVGTSDCIARRIGNAAARRIRVDIDDLVGLTFC